MIDYIIFSIQIAIASLVGTITLGIIIPIGFALIGIGLVLIGIPIWAIGVLYEWIRKNFYKEAKE